MLHICQCNVSLVLVLFSVKGLELRWKLLTLQLMWMIILYISLLLLKMTFLSTWIKHQKVKLDIFLFRPCFQKQSLKVLKDWAVTVNSNSHIELLLSQLHYQCLLMRAQCVDRKMCNREHSIDRSANKRVAIQYVIQNYYR